MLRMTKITNIKNGFVFCKNSLISVVWLHDLTEVKGNVMVLNQTSRNIQYLLLEDKNWIKIPMNFDFSVKFM